jgi:hypothetical protein
MNQLSDNAHFSIRDNFTVASNFTATHLIKKCVGVDINFQSQIWALRTVNTFPQQLSPVDQTSDPELERDGRLGRQFSVMFLRNQLENVNSNAHFRGYLLTFRYRRPIICIGSSDDSGRRPRQLSGF